MRRDVTQRHMTEGDRARDARLKAAREGGGVGVLPGVEKEGEEPKTVGSCHHPELSSASELRLGKKKKKSLSLLNLQLTPEYVTTSISTPLRCWTHKARHASCESA